MQLRVLLKNKGKNDIVNCTYQKRNCVFQKIYCFEKNEILTDSRFLYTHGEYQVAFMRKQLVDRLVVGAFACKQRTKKTIDPKTPPSHCVCRKLAGLVSKKIVVLYLWESER